MDALQIANAYEGAIQVVRELGYAHAHESQPLEWAVTKRESVMGYLQNQAWDELHAMLDEPREVLTGLRDMEVQR